MKTTDFDYNLPEELIAQTPIEPRDSARLLVLGRLDGSISHTIFREISRYLNPGDLLILNETRVIPARLHANKIPGGGKLELLLLRELDANTWEALVGGKRMTEGSRFVVWKGGPEGEIVAVMDGARRTVRFAESLGPSLMRLGETPLPPYIRTPLNDPDRYQTVYSRKPGSVAAPTAGLHFTVELLDRLREQGVLVATVTLHVGLDTFAPVTEEIPGHHRIHTEWCQVPEDTARVINQVRKAGGRIVAVGTTSVRALESAARKALPGEAVGVLEGPTDLFIFPGHPFRVVDGMITNFHLPRSTLLMLVSAFAGRERILEVYEIAKQAGYRFFSFGDAMLIL